MKAPTLPTVSKLSEVCENFSLFFCETVVPLTGLCAYGASFFLFHTMLMPPEHYEGPRIHIGVGQVTVEGLD